jgi:uncharacterized protein YidB (DUF937 family)
MPEATMGLLDVLLGSLAGMEQHPEDRRHEPGGGALGGLGPAVLMQVIAAMLANRGGGAMGGGSATGGAGGGLGELLERFRGAGFGEQAESWVRPGPNIPISPGDLGSVLGDDVVGGLARHTGLPQGDLLDQLSRMLPQAVDRVTPEGRVPAGGLGDIGDILRRFD